MSPRDPKGTPGRRVPSKSHGLRGPGPSGRPPRDAAPTPTPPASGESTPTSGGTPPAASFGTPTTRPGSRAANRAAKRAASPTGVRPKTQVRRSSRPPSRGSSQGLILLGVIAVVVVAALVIIGNPFGSASASASPGASGTPIPTRLLAGCPTAAPAGLAAGVKRTVTLATTKGDIVIEVSADLAPVAAANFVALAECGFYDGVIFHRVIPDFMIQGGDGEFAWSGGLVEGSAGKGGPGYDFPDEPINGSYTRGTVAMANSGADTNGSQFFIMVKDTDLPKNYVIFGQVTSGMDVADQIVAGSRNADDYPDEPVVITSATVAPLPTPGATAAPSAAPASPSAAPAS